MCIYIYVYVYIDIHNSITAQISSFEIVFLVIGRIILLKPNFYRNISADEQRGWLWGAGDFEGSETGGLDDFGIFWQSPSIWGCTRQLHGDRRS